MTNTWTVVSVIIAAIAALAATMQSWIALQARTDFRKAVILSQTVERCADLIPIFALTDAGLKALVEEKTDALQPYLARAEREFGTLRWLVVVMEAVNSETSTQLGQSVASLEEASVNRIAEADDKQKQIELAATLADTGNAIENACAALMGVSLGRGGPVFFW